MRTVKRIPVFFHNLAGNTNPILLLGYDSHIIFRNLNKMTLNSEPIVIAKGMENFITFQIQQLTFKDALQFLNSSLDKLVNNLKEKAEKPKDKLPLEQVFPNLNKYFQEKWWHLPNPKEAFKMLTRKGVYPYGYMDSFGKNIS